MRMNKLHKAYGLIKKMLTETWQLSKNYAVSYALHNLLWWICFYARPPFAHRLSTYAIKKKTAWLDQYIEKNYDDIISQFKTNLPKEEEAEDNKRIWVFWYQGEEQMPPLIKACYTQLTKHNNNVTLITKDNLRQYIQLPDIIYKKAEKGTIKLANFSDIVRHTLLDAYGGLWIDATVWVPYAIPFEKMVCHPIFTANCKYEGSDRSIRFWTTFEWNWSTWCLWSRGKHYPLYAFVSKMLQTIAIREKCWPDYVAMDYIIYYACRKFNSIGDDMEKIPLKNPLRNELANRMNQPFNKKDYEDLVKNECFFKLSFRTDWQKSTKDGSLTYYGFLLSQNNQQSNYSS